MVVFLKVEHRKFKMLPPFSLPVKSIATNNPSAIHEFLRSSRVPESRVKWSYIKKYGKMPETANPPNRQIFRF